MTPRNKIPVLNKHQPRQNINPLTLHKKKQSRGGKEGEVGILVNLFYPLNTCPRLKKKIICSIIYQKEEG